MRDPAERLRDILEAIAAIERRADCTRQSFERDELLQTWFLRHLQIIGEATRAIPEEVRASRPKFRGIRSGDAERFGSWVLRGGYGPCLGHGNP